MRDLVEIHAYSRCYDSHEKTTCLSCSAPLSRYSRLQLRAAERQSAREKRSSIIGPEDTHGEDRRNVAPEVRQQLDLLRQWEELEPDRCQSIQSDWYQLQLSCSGGEAVWEGVGYWQSPQVARAIAQAAVQKAVMSRKWAYRVETIFEAGGNGNLVCAGRPAANVYACDEGAVVVSLRHDVSNSPAEALLRAYLEALKQAPMEARHQCN